jgi:hypothetical protein
MLVLLVACATEPSGLVEEPLYGGTWDPPTREMLADVALPLDGDGDMVLMPGSTVGIIVDLEDRTPVTAAAECAALVTSCLDPQRNVLGCLQNVQVCDNDEPWLGDDPFCCPSACEDRYIELREDGREEADALTTALFGDAPCTPGLN